MISSLAAFSLLIAGAAKAQVTAVGPNGPTNPAAPALNTPLNQTSYARLISLNTYDDFCLFAPPYFATNDTTDASGNTKYASLIGNTEGEEVAWCTKQRNNARLIPDGTITSVHFVKTPLYVQIRGFGDLTQLNIPYGDYGGELDPHGATGAGNPVGGNVTTNVSGSDVFYEEWMMFVSYNQFCLRICTSQNSTYSAALECQHQIDKLGCDWVMPGETTNNTFTSCDADAAYPPGVYPIDSQSTSTFAQAFTGTYTQNGQPIGYTIGVDVTPTAAYSTPASSNCVTHTQSPANGVTDVAYQGYNAPSGAATSLGPGPTGATASGASGSASGIKATTKTTAGTATSTSTSTSTATTQSSGSAQLAVAGTSGVLGFALAVIAAAF